MIPLTLVVEEGLIQQVIALHIDCDTVWELDMT